MSRYTDQFDQFMEAVYRYAPLANQLDQARAEVARLEPEVAKMAADLERRKQQLRVMLGETPAKPKKPRRNGLRRQVLLWMSSVGSVRIEQVCDAHDIPYGRCGKMLGEMVGDGQVERVGNGIYRSVA